MAIESTSVSAWHEAEQPTLVGNDADLRKVNELETVDALRRLRKLEEWLEQERQRQAHNRYQMALDEDFFDGLQWSDEDAAALIERGQAPLVYNKVAPTVKWVTGTEKRTRIDWKVYPRSDDDAAAAEAKTKLLKYVQDVNKSAFARSQAFLEAMRAGVGWLECGIRADPTEFIIYDRAESWRNLWYDSLGQDMAQQDWRYMIRKKQIDTDIALLLWPSRKDAILAGSSFSEQLAADDDDEWYLGTLLRDHATSQEYIPANRYLGSGITDSFNRRSRLPVYEMWYRYPTRVWMIQGGPLHGREFDPKWAVMQDMLNNGAISLYDRVVLRMRCGIFIRGTFLQDVRSPYRHDRFPFTPIWGNRRARDAMPYGMIRNLRDPQEDFNKRMSKALFAISTRRVIADKGAVDDWDKLREEAARPDALLVVNPGKKLELQTDTDVAQHHIDYAMLDARMIQDAAGVTDENMGRRTNATSGIAIERRQEQGAAVTADYFDNLRLAIQLHGEKLLSLTEQFVTMPMQVRIIGERAGYDFTAINWMKKGSDGQPEILNDITASQADFIVSQQDFRETIREAAFEELMNMLTKLMAVNPEAAMRMLDDVIEMSNVPGKDDLVATIREITGKVPRDKRLTEEEQQAEEQAKQAKAQEAQAMKQLQLRGIMAEIAEKEAKAKQLEAQATQAVSEANAAGDGGAAIRAEYDQQIAKLREDTAKLVQALKDTVMQARLEAKNNAAEIAAKERMASEDRASQERIAKDRIAADERIAKHKTEKDASTKVETAKTAAKAKAAPADDGKAKAQSDQLAQQIDQLRKDVQAALKEAQANQKVALSEVKTSIAEQRAKDAEGRAKEAKAEKPEPDGKAEAKVFDAILQRLEELAQAVSEVTAEKEVSVEFDAKGNAKAVVKPKRAPSKKRSS